MNAMSFVRHLSQGTSHIKHGFACVMSRLLLTALFSLQAFLIPTSVADAATFVGNTTGDWTNPATWSGSGVPGVDDEINILTNVNVSVTTNEQFGGAGATAVSFWENSGETLSMANAILTHNDGPFAFEIRPQTSGANLHRIRGANGTFINNGLILQKVRNNNADNTRFNDSGFSFQNNGIWEFQDIHANGVNLRSNGILVEGNNISININSTGAGTGSAGGNFRVNMANNPNFVSSLNFRQSETLNTMSYLGDVGEVPFNIVAGNFLMGLPGRGDSFTYNGANFNGATVPLFSSFDRNVFEALFGSAVGDIPTNSRVGVAGAFDTINLVSANSGSTASPYLHNYNGRIGIGDGAWQDVGNMMPTTTGGTLTITAASDVDWYSGGFNTRGGLIENNGTLTAGVGMTLARDENSTGTSVGTMYIGQSSGSNGEFRNTATGIVRIEEGTLAVRDATNTFNNQVGGLVQVGASTSNSGAFDVRDSASMTNSGTFELLGNNARLGLFDGGAGGFTQEAGATFNVNPGGGNRAFLQSNNTARFFNNNSGTTAFNLQSGTFNFGPNDYQIAGVSQPSLLSNNALINSQFNVTPGTTLEVGSGTWTLIDPDPSGLLPAGLTLVGNIAGQGARTPTGGTMTYGDGVDDLTYIWTQGNMSAVGGGEFINNTVIDRQGSAGRINSGGLFTNAAGGTYRQSAAGVMYFDSNGTSFDNFGLVEFTDNDASFRFNANDQILTNKAGGIMRANTPSENNALLFRTNGTRTGNEFTNEGTIEVLRGIMRIEDTVSASVFAFSGVSSTSLDTGTYRVISTGTDRAQLDLEVNGATSGTDETYAGSIVSIGAGAGLVLSADEAIGANAGAQLPQLGVISTLQGSLYVHGAVNLPVDSALNVESGATIGGSGTYDMQGGTLTLDDGSIFDPSALNGGGGTLTIDGGLALSNTTQVAFSLQTPNVVGGDNDLVVVNGDLALDGELVLQDIEGLDYGTYRLFNYTGNLTDNGLFVGNPLYNILDTSIAGQVNLTLLPVPEPSSGLLLLIGLLVIRRRRRQ